MKTPLTLRVDASQTDVLLVFAAFLITGLLSIAALWTMGKLSPSLTLLALGTYVVGAAGTVLAVRYHPEGEVVAG